ncbi:MAG: ABC transporter permease [Verrucomicrobia bacterium]|nr:ABC transporter permease [Verrucomicrobiota bacterium]
MRRILAIARLTIKAAVRYKLVWMLSALLVMAVGVMPMFLKAAGRPQDISQLLITYSLSAVVGLLGIATLWLACGTLARDIEDCQLQMVTVKPVARWEIWIGKWLGIMALNTFLLVISGAAIFLILQYRVSKLSAEDQRLLREEVLVARGSVKEPAMDVEPVVQQVFNERIKQQNVAAMDRTFVLQQVREQVKQEFQIVRPGTGRRWRIPLGLARFQSAGKPLFIRTKFTATEKSPSGTFVALWQAGVPDTPKLWRYQMSLAPDAYHQFEIPPDLFDDQGVLTVEFYNPNETSLLFQLEDGMEVLYPEAGFGLNFARGLGVILLWLGLLAFVGLAAASLLAFPVAAFFSVGLMVIVFSSGTMAQALQEGTVWEVNHETGVADEKAPVDYIILPVFRGALQLIGLVEEFSPIDSLSTGRSISWNQLGRAMLQVWVVLGGVFALFGVVTLTRREIALPPGSN